MELLLKSSEGLKEHLCFLSLSLPPDSRLLPVLCAIFLALKELPFWTAWEEACKGSPWPCPKTCHTTIFQQNQHAILFMNLCSKLMFASLALSSLKTRLYYSISNSIQVSLGPRIEAEHKSRLGRRSLSSGLATLAAASWFIGGHVLYEASCTASRFIFCSIISNDDD